jgi:excisionase family DNA binding protein
MQLLNVNQVAELLNLKPKTVREYIRQGRLSAVNLNPVGLRPVWRIKPSALKDMQTSRVEEIVLDIKRGMGL